jgi:hypothetical protein
VRTLGTLARSKEDKGRKDLQKTQTYEGTALDVRV